MAFAAYEVFVAWLTTKCEVCPEVGEDFVSTEVGEVTGGRETQLTFRDTR